MWQWVPDVQSGQESGLQIFRQLLQTSEADGGKEEDAGQQLKLEHLAVPFLCF